MDLFVVTAVVVVLFIHSFFFNEMEKASNLFQLFFLNKLKYFVVYDFCAWHCKTKSIGGKH